MYVRIETDRERHPCARREPSQRKTGAAMSSGYRRRTRPKSQTKSLRTLRRERASHPSLTSIPECLPERPATRAECPDTRPCPWVGCRYHMYLDVNPRIGSIKINFPDLEPWELAETCALDVAERMAEREPDQEGRHATFDEIGELMNISRERGRQIEAKALARMRRHGRLK